LHNKVFVNLHDISKEHNIVRTVNYGTLKLAWLADPVRQKMKPTEH